MEQPFITGSSASILIVPARQGIPGMIGEAAVLSRLEVFMPKLHVASGGRYGAFLFATYAVVLTVAELVTLRAR